MQRHFIEIDGARMSYIDQGQGFPVLLGHSYLWSAEMWQPQIDALSQHFRVIVPELWGHGGSDAPPAMTIDMHSLVRQHLALLDALDITKCHLVGLSVGGMWGHRWLLPTLIELTAWCLWTLTWAPSRRRPGSNTSPCWMPPAQPANSAIRCSTSSCLFFSTQAARPCRKSASGFVPN